MKGKNDDIMNIKKKAFGFSLIIISVLIILMLPLLPVKMNRVVDFPTLNKVEEDIAIVFFGYPGCNSACPIALATLSDVYNAYYPLMGKNPLTLLFVNLIPNATIESSENFVNEFNKNIGVLPLTDQEISKAKTVFGLKFSDIQEDGQLFHKGYTYLLEREDGIWRIRYVYVSGAPIRDEVYSDILTLVAE